MKPSAPRAKPKLIGGTRSLPSDRIITPEEFIPLPEGARKRMPCVGERYGEEMPLDAEGRLRATREGRLLAKPFVQRLARVWHIPEKEAQARYDAFCMVAYDLLLAGHPVSLAGIGAVAMYEKEMGPFAQRKHAKRFRGLFEAIQKSTRTDMAAKIRALDTCKYHIDNPPTVVRYFRVRQTYGQRIFLKERAVYADPDVVLADAWQQHLAETKGAPDPNHPLFNPNSKKAKKRHDRRQYRKDCIRRAFDQLYPSRRTA